MSGTAGGKGDGFGPCLGGFGALPLGGLSRFTTFGRVDI